MLGWIAESVDEGPSASSTCARKAPARRASGPGGFARDLDNISWARRRSITWRWSSTTCRRTRRSSEARPCCGATSEAGSGACRVTMTSEFRRFLRSYQLACLRMGKRAATARINAERAQLCSAPVTGADRIRAAERSKVSVAELQPLRERSSSVLDRLPYFSAAVSRFVDRYFERLRRNYTALAKTEHTASS